MFSFNSHQVWCLAYSCALTPSFWKYDFFNLNPNDKALLSLVTLLCLIYIYNAIYKGTWRASPIMIYLFILVIKVETVFLTFISVMTMQMMMLTPSEILDTCLCKLTVQAIFWSVPPPVNVWPNTCYSCLLFGEISVEKGIKDIFVEIFCILYQHLCRAS